MNIDPLDLDPSLPNDLDRERDERIESEYEEALHAVRQRGYDAVAKRETVCAVLSAVHRSIDHRLENIRLYTDREKPNREEILALVIEIESRLAEIDKEFSQ